MSIFSAFFFFSFFKTCTRNDPFKLQLHLKQQLTVVFESRQGGPRPLVERVWDQARKLRCTWHDQYEKSVTFRPFPVDMLDVVRADFAGDNVGCWMQIQVGKGPWASEVSGLVKIGQTMTMVLAIKDDDGKFDMLVRNCMAHDGKRAPIQLVDQKGCVTRPKLMSRFTKIKNFGSSASVLSYAHFQVK